MFLDQLDKSDLSFFGDDKYIKTIQSIDDLLELQKKARDLYKKMQMALLLKACSDKGHDKIYIVTSITRGISKQKIFTNKNIAFKFHDRNWGSIIGTIATKINKNKS